MNDCPNAEIRDQLPDLLHDRLDVSLRAAVMAHVDACVDCRAELELLRGVRGLLVARTPRVDINYVVNALPKPSAATHALPSRLTPRRRVWSDWRIAAAVTVLAVGGGSFALLRQGVNPSTADTVLAQASSIGSANTSSRDSVTAAAPSRVADASAAPSGSTSVARGTTTSADEQAGLATTARLADLNERQLQALLDQIDQLQAVPITEPEPVTLRVNKSSSPEGA
jgi:hypothetical protein